MRQTENSRRSTPTRRVRSGRVSAAAGFTLIELMIVVVIIGVLAVVVVPNMMGAADDAKVTAAKAQIRSLDTALTNYKLKFNKYPSTGEGLQALINNSKQNFLQQDNVPKDPWGYEYVYTSPGAKGHAYEIVCYGEDGQPGGSEYGTDIVSWDLQGSGNQ